MKLSSELTVSNTAEIKTGDKLYITTTCRKLSWWSKFKNKFFDTPLPTETINFIVGDVISDTVLEVIKPTTNQEN